MNTSISSIRTDYKMASFSEKDAAINPFIQFTRWWNDAIISHIEEVNAMTLATVTAKGSPSARIVLLKDYSDEGFVFFTNYQSDKGKEIAQNPHVCLVFFWKELERQIRIEGIAEKVSNAENDAYFNSRPDASKIGAWASHQSSIIPYRQVIEENVKRYTEIFKDSTIERPDYWGGYCVKPNLVEFWQGRPSRLHDRIQYTLHNNIWTLERLSP
ncbi:MAG: pyridoxamine 5'-phosphate oxidase [Chitinophagaceae bacterium]|nr:pyridoxamine 5'-phosphate oxidase [Chitinophagaceae bacterium]MCW5904412.1 pyridoxamine 5'-phosphate oxidase [Chitinophagaceae bacterium]